MDRSDLPKMYSTVFSEHPKLLANHGLSLRKDAKQAAFLGTVHFGISRRFQG